MIFRNNQQADLARRMQKDLDKPRIRSYCNTLCSEIVQYKHDAVCPPQITQRRPRSRLLEKH